MLCDYGCGQEAKHQLGNGKWCCSENWRKCPQSKMKLSNKLKERWRDLSSGFYSENRSKKISESNKKNMKKGSVTRENFIKKIKKKWEDPKSKYNQENYRKSLQESGTKRYYKKIKIDKMCDYGCGQVAKYLFPKTNKYCCEKTWQSCIEKKKESQILSTLFISNIKKKYPTFVKIEEMRYNPDKPGEKEIQVHCKNHNCKNSKEQGGWFTPITREQFFNRIYSIENDEANNYYYCSEKCKIECPLYGKRVSQLIKQDQIKAGIIKEDLYTKEEYQTYRQQVLERENHKCEYCGEQAVHVHHSRPQKLEPGFVLDPDFGIACCEEHHYKYGHKDECSTGQLANIICMEAV